jgi:hypothetical protein
MDESAAVLVAGSQLAAVVELGAQSMPGSVAEGKPDPDPGAAPGLVAPVSV